MVAVGRDACASGLHLETPPYRGASAAKVLASFFGSDEIPFTITTSTAPGGVRSYTSFSQAAEENMVSRIYIGYHFRSACRHGFNQGSQVAHWAFHNYLQPIGP